MSHRIPAEVKRQLRPTESVLWVGKPRTGIVLRTIDAFLIPLSILWALLAVWWEFIAISSLLDGLNVTDLILCAAGFPLVASGLYMAVGRYVVDVTRRASSTYCITSERAMIVEPGKDGKQVRSIELSRGLQIRHLPREGGLGTIVFGPAAQQYEWADHWKVTSLITKAGSSTRLFEMIPDADQVMALIQNVRNGHSPHPLVSDR